jgi:hypothetical protein
MDLEAFLSGSSPARGRRSSAASWHEDEGRLVGVSRHGSGDRSLELLAFGLQGLDGRELHLVVPRQAVNATRARAAFLTATVHVHKTQATGIGDAEPPMSVTEATRFYRRLGKPSEPAAWEAADWDRWLKDLVDWVESRRVERVRNSERHAWHYRGRQVLSVRRFAAGGCELVAGVNYRAPTGDQPAPVKLRVPAEQTLTPEQVAEVKDAVDHAIERRRTGDDDKHREHLLQAAIGTEPGLIGMTQLRREVAAWRPKYRTSGGLALIDFLGRDVDRIGHVVETKIAPDAQLGIQTLDHWAWATAYHSELADHVDADPTRPFKLDVVLARSSRPLLHPAAAATLEALRDNVDWRCHIVSDWDTIDAPRQLLTPRGQALPPRELPAGDVQPIADTDSDPVL